jgi:hypothetical protein
VSSAAPAQASGGPVQTTSYAAINQQVYNGWIAFDKPLAEVTAGSSGIQATIHTERSYTTSIELSLGASKGVIAGSLGFSTSATTATGASCSATLKAGQTLTMYPKGTHKYYNIRRVVYPPGTASTSATLEAWQPAPTLGVYCKVT